MSPLSNLICAEKGDFKRQYIPRSKCLPLSFRIDTSNNSTHSSLSQPILSQKCVKHVLTGELHIFNVTWHSWKCMLYYFRNLPVPVLPTLLAPSTTIFTVLLGTQSSRGYSGMGTSRKLPEPLLLLLMVPGVDSPVNRIEIHSARKTTPAPKYHWLQKKPNIKNTFS